MYTIHTDQYGNEYDAVELAQVALRNDIRVYRRARDIAYSVYCADDESERAVVFAAQFHEFHDTLEIAAQKTWPWAVFDVEDLAEALHRFIETCDC